MHSSASSLGFVFSMRDKAGREVRKALIPLFDKARRIRDWNAKLHGYVSGLPNIEKYHPEDIDLDLKEVQRILIEVADRVDSRLPHVICTACQGHDPICVCKGRGWLSKSQMVVPSRKKKPTSEVDTSPTDESGAS